MRDDVDLVQRLERIEGSLSRWRMFAIGAGVSVCVVVLGAANLRPQDVLRVRGLIVVDEQGHERVMIGAPVPSAAGTGRRSPMAGIAINDDAGRQRFGVGLLECGDMIMGVRSPAEHGRRPEPRAHHPGR
jgi:hypothetical protein